MLEKERMQESTKTAEMRALQESDAKLEVCISSMCADSVSMLDAAIVCRE